MELTVLVDNNTSIDHYFWAEPGVSYFIKEGKTRILFDVGYTDVFIRNAEKMNIDLLVLDFVVLSHGHLDHTWGLFPLAQLYTEAVLEKTKHHKPTLVAHPCVFDTRTLNGVGEFGSIISKQKISRFFETKLSRKPVWLTKSLVFLGEIQRKNDFEAKSPIGKILRSELEQDDYVVDDTALAYRGEQGLVIITGCSHAGICNIVEYAKEICGEKRVVDIIGRFHLLNPSESQLRGTVEYMKKLQARAIHACHCTDLRSKLALSSAGNLKDVAVGLRLKY